MKVLTLVRHAKSSWDFPELEDFDRPLNKRGKRDAPEMGRRLADAEYVPDLIVSSPANRALTTARVVAGTLGIDSDDIVEDARIYHASPRALTEVVREIGNGVTHVMLFGHNPGFTDFANRLSDVRVDNIPTSGIFSVSFDVSDWAEFEAADGSFVFFDYPKNNASNIPGSNA